MTGGLWLGIYVQATSTHGDEAAGAVLVSRAAFLKLSLLLIWLATVSRL